MKIIFAQGNPGGQYTLTRHNIGWLCLDFLAQNASANFTHKPKFQSAIAELSLNGEKILLAKPTTFYNETGQAARALIDFYKLNPAEDLLVIHDDLMLEFGKIRVRLRGRDAGNNGIKSLNAHIGQDFMRLRLGIYSKLRDRINDADFVLKNFSKEEQTVINDKVIPATVSVMESFAVGRLTADSFSVL